MKIEQIVIPAGLLAAAVAVWVYLKGGNAGAGTQVSYPNATAGGLPQYQSPGIAYNFGTRQAAPSPSLTLGPPPAIPPTPAYQRYNFAPMNFFNLTPEASAKVPAGTPGGAGSATKPLACGCCCDCGCDSNHPVFQDGNQSTGVSANKGEQAGATQPSFLADQLANLASSVAVNEQIAWQAFAHMSSNPSYPIGQ